MTASWYGFFAMVHKAEVAGFPQSQGRLPVLLPTRHSALRPRLNRWFEAQGLQPHIVGEFEDSALLAVFAARGFGVFPLGRSGAAPVSRSDAVRLHGCHRCTDEGPIRTREVPLLDEAAVCRFGLQTGLSPAPAG